jgi:hypothetical protein
MTPGLEKAAEELKKVGLDLAQVLRDTHTETAVKLGGLLEGHLEIAIRAKMMRNNEPIDEKIFKPRGELDNLDKKIRRAQKLKLIDSVGYRDATQLRKIRNSFAHEKEKVHFDSAVIVAFAKNLSTYESAENNQTAILKAASNVMDQLEKSVKG